MIVMLVLYKLENIIWMMVIGENLCIKFKKLYVATCHKNSKPLNIERNV